MSENNKYEKELNKIIDKKIDNNDNNKERKPIISDAFFRALAWFSSTIGVMMLFGYILNYLKIYILSLLVSANNKILYFFAFIGSPIREISQVIVCKIFQFDILTVRFSNPFSIFDSLGEVLYTHKPNTILGYIGDFFFDLAPVLFGGFFILLVLKILVPEAYKEADKQSDATWLKSKKFRGVKSTFAFIKGFFSGLFSIKGFGFIREIIAIFLILSISTHMTWYFNRNLYRDSATGLFIIFGLFFVFGLITSLLRVKNYLMDAVEVASGLIMFFMIGVLADLFLIGIIKAYPYIVDFFSLIIQNIKSA